MHRSESLEASIAVSGTRRLEERQYRTDRQIGSAEPLRLKQDRIDCITHFDVHVTKRVQVSRNYQMCTKSDVSPYFSRALYRQDPFHCVTRCCTIVIGLNLFRNVPLDVNVPTMLKFPRFRACACKEIQPMPPQLEEFLTDEIDALKRDAARFVDTDLLLAASELDEDEFNEEEQECATENDTEAAECDQSAVLEHRTRLTDRALVQNFASRMIQNAVDDVRSFAETVTILAGPPVRMNRTAYNSHRVQSLNDESQKVYYTYEEQKAAAAQSIHWLMSSEPTNQLSISFVECADALECGLGPDGMSGFRKLLLGRLPITSKLVTALLEHVEELEHLSDTVDSVY